MCTLTTRKAKKFLKEHFQNFAASDDAFPFMSSIKGTQTYLKQFFFDAPAIFKQLSIHKYFLTLSCAYLKWEELHYIQIKQT